MEEKLTTIQKEYISRINKSFDFIEKNLDKSFDLKELSDAASFSKFHFHRIFSAIVGETPQKFIQRIRLERAVTYLNSNNDETISDIALKVGYSDISVFSRNFKNHFGVSASEYRKSKHIKSKNHQEDSNPEKKNWSAQQYFCSRSQTVKWKTNMELNKSVEVKELQEMNVAYVRYIGPYKGNSNLFEGLWNKLFAWAGPRGLIGGPDFKSLIIYHDDPNITEEEKLRVSVCITVPENTKVDGEVGLMKVDAGKYVEARFVVDASQFQTAWEWVYGEWLPNSGYQPDDRPCFEVYPEEPKDGKFTVDICVPVKPL
jgi:AraC family transcriptional regulator